METTLLLALMGYAFVNTVTPGPNNLMLIASGANFGFRRTIPHMVGITVGICVMIFLVGFGLVGLFDRYPVTHSVLRVVSIVYMAWLTWKIATAAAPGQTDAAGRPFTALQAALFQWVNPKAWAMAFPAFTAFAPDRSVQEVLIVTAAFGLVSFPSISVWTWMGGEIRRFLGTATRLRTFNWTMAALLVASMVPLLRA